MDRAIGTLLKADDDQEVFAEYLRESLFYDHKRNHYFSDARLVAFFSRVFSAGPTRITAQQRHRRRLQLRAANFAERAGRRLALGRAR